jgi:hypothetical protein
MAGSRKGVRSIKTMAALVDRRRSRTTAGALLEMSVLANEKERLRQELEAAERRRLEIEARLVEIEEKEGRLAAFLQDPTLKATNHAPVTEGPQGVKMKEISY